MLQNVGDERLKQTMTIRDLLQKIEDLKRSGLLRDESQVCIAFIPYDAEGEAYEVVAPIATADRETADHLTLRA